MAITFHCNVLLLSHLSSARRFFIRQAAFVSARPRTRKDGFLVMTCEQRGNWSILSEQKMLQQMGKDLRSSPRSAFTSDSTG